MFALSLLGVLVLSAIVAVVALPLLTNIAKHPILVLCEFLTWSLAFCAVFGLGQYVVLHEIIFKILLLINFAMHFQFQYTAVFASRFILTLPW